MFERTMPAMNKHALGLALVFALSCARDGDLAGEPTGRGGSTMSMKITSSAFTEGGEIPATYTCEGDDRAPPLAFSSLPPGTKSLALIVDDPDAPDPKAPKRTWVHWVVYDIPPSTTSLPAGGSLPEGARLGKNDWGRQAFGGPCPPIGRHRYFHKLYALDVALGDLGACTKAELEKAMTGHVLARSELVGTYQKQKQD